MISFQHDAMARIVKSMLAVLTHGRDEVEPFVYRQVVLGVDRGSQRLAVHLHVVTVERDPGRQDGRKARVVPALATSPTRTGLRATWRSTSAAARAERYRPYGRLPC